MSRQKRSSDKPAGQTKQIAQTRAAEIVNEAKRRHLKTPEDVIGFHAFVLERLNAR